MPRCGQKRPSCIEAARRAQRIQAAVEAPATLGYAQASLGHMALRAGKPVVVRLLGVRGRLRFWVSCSLMLPVLAGYWIGFKQTGYACKSSIPYTLINASPLRVLLSPYVGKPLFLFSW